MEHFNLNLVVFMAMMVAATMQLHGTVAQTRHVVGDGLGWTVPSGGAVAYSTWASLQTFREGDLLVFTFTDGEHDVAEVSAAAYGPCNPTNPISLSTNGPATLTLTTPGPHYYMCTFRSHCQIGQKLSINVTGGSSTTTPPSGTPRTPTTRTPPSATPRTPESPTTTTTPTPPATPSIPCPPNSSTSSCPSSPPTTTFDDSPSPPPPPPPSDETSSFTAVAPATFLIIGLAFLNYFH